MFLTDGGLETTLIFHHDLDLPCFAAFDLVNRTGGTEILEDYFKTHARIAVSNGLGFVLEAPTWRASRAWGEQLGYSAEMLDRANRECVDLMAGVRHELEGPDSPMPISACIGPRGDGYSPDDDFCAESAHEYHRRQISSFADSPVDMVSAFTMTRPEEAIGITRAAEEAGLPAVISFTTETDGRLPGGMSLAEAIQRVDEDGAQSPAYFMINCAHCSHFAHEMEHGNQWLTKVRGIRANASRLSHAELDESETLDDGDPMEMRRDYSQLLECNRQVKVLGGCCGTDHRHLAEIGKALRV